MPQRMIRSLLNKTNNNCHSIKSTEETAKFAPKRYSTLIRNHQPFFSIFGQSIALSSTSFPVLSVSQEASLLTSLALLPRSSFNVIPFAVDMILSGSAAFWKQNKSETVYHITQALQSRQNSVMKQKRFRVQKKISPSTRKNSVNASEIN